MSLHLHFVTDILSVIAAGLAGIAVRYQRPQLRNTAQAARSTPVYWLILASSALFGAYWFGTLNIMLSQAALPSLLQADGIAGSPVKLGTILLGRSAFGAIFGGVLGIEIYKTVIGRKGSTGAVFVIPLAVGMVVGRFGCLFSGMDDFTYGRPTDLPWGWNFGDGIPRHPAPLYEILAMAGFLLWFLWWSGRDEKRAANIGFYVFIAYYSLQRFLVEFTKPYGGIFGAPAGWPDLDVFQIGALLLFVYAFWMINRVSVEPKAMTGTAHAGG
jgi:hypothetical protein